MTGTMAAPLARAARDRLKAQVQRERELAEAVLAAETRLGEAIAKSDAIVAAQQRVIAGRRAEVAQALSQYVNEAGLGLDRAAIILGRTKADLARSIRDARSAELGNLPGTPA